MEISTQHERTTLMKLYLGARYTRKDEARGLAETLVRNGFEVTAT